MRLTCKRNRQATSQYNVIYPIRTNGQKHTSNSTFIAHAEICIKTSQKWLTSKAQKLCLLYTEKSAVPGLNRCTGGAITVRGGHTKKGDPNENPARFTWKEGEKHGAYEK